jgi:biopolymer transport protein ExbB/TolQ
MIATVPLTEWLRSRLGVVSPEERKGISLSREDALQLPAPRDLALLIRAFDVMAPSSILYLEGGDDPPEPDLRQFLTANRIVNPVQVARHTIWPRQAVNHLLLTAETIQYLARFAETVAGPELCLHLAVYRDGQVLVSAHDAPNDPVLISHQLPEELIDRFARRLKFSLRDVKPARAAMAAKEPRLLTWGLPLVGLAGTIAAMLITFARIGTEPQWKTVLLGLGLGLVVVVAGLIVLLPCLSISRKSVPRENAEDH